MKRDELISQWGYVPNVVTRIIRAKCIDDLPEQVQDAAWRRERECLTSPPWDDIEAHCLDAYLDTCGLECIELVDDYGDPLRVEYLNTGDTYASTLMRVGHPSLRRSPEICTYGSWHVSSVGDYAERYPERAG